MKVAFLTESEFSGKIPFNHPNCRTEYAWQIALNSDHFNIHHYDLVSGYDVVFIIFPKALVKLNRIGVEMLHPVSPRDEHNMLIYQKPVVETLKSNNKKVCNIQEGPSDLFNDYPLDIQFHFYNQLSSCDILFAHNKSDVKFYKGLFPGKKVTVIPSLMIAPPNPPIPEKENKTIISGNFAKWYGGFQSYMVASTFDYPIYVPSSHCKRNGEEQVPNLKHLPWVMWNQWMQQLSTFKYAVNLMPTVAAGTFSLNCSYWGIPCIGNKDVDTQSTLFPDLSVDINDIDAAVTIAGYLKDESYYSCKSFESRMKLNDSYHFNQQLWIAHIIKNINE